MSSTADTDTAAAAANENALGFDPSSCPPTFLDSLFRDVHDLTQWSEQVPSFFVLSGGAGGDGRMTFVHADDLDMFPLAFLFSRRITKDRLNFCSALLIDKSIATICAGWNADDFPYEQLSSLRSSRKNVRVVSALADKCYLIAEMYHVIAEKIAIDVQTNLSTRTDDESFVFPRKPIYMSHQAIRELDALIELCGKIAQSYDVAVAKVLSSGVAPAFLDIYRQKFDVFKDLLTNIHQKTQVVDDSLEDFQLNNHSESVFALTDAVRVMLLYCMLTATLKCALLYASDAVDCLLTGEIADEDYKDDDAELVSLLGKIRGTERLTRLLPEDDRTFFRETASSNRKIATHFREGLLFILKYMDVRALVDKCKQTVAQVLEQHPGGLKKKITKIEEYPQLVFDLIHQGKELQDLLKQEGGDSFQEVGELLQFCRDLNSSKTAVYKAYHLCPEKFHGVIALLKQKMDIISKDFTRTVACFVLKTTKLLAKDLSRCDRLYFSLVACTNVDLHQQGSRTKEAAPESTAVGRRDFHRLTTDSMIAEVNCVRQLCQSAALHALCFFAVSRRHCRSSPEKQERREKLSMLIARQYFELVVPMLAEFTKAKKSRELSFFESLLSFSKLVDQNVLNMNKTFLAVL